MAHFLTVPINANGIITDKNIDEEIQRAANCAVRVYRRFPLFAWMVDQRDGVDGRLQ